MKTFFASIYISSAQSLTYCQTKFQLQKKAKNKKVELTEQIEVLFTNQVLNISRKFYGLNFSARTDEKLWRSVGLPDNNKNLEITTTKEWKFPWLSSCKNLTSKYQMAFQRNETRSFAQCGARLQFLWTVSWPAELLGPKAWRGTGHKASINISQCSQLNAATRASWMVTFFWFFSYIFFHFY